MSTTRNCHNHPNSTVRKRQGMITASWQSSLSHYFPDNFCFTLSTAEISKQISEYDQEIPQSQTADKLKFKRQFSESRLTMRYPMLAKPVMRRCIPPSHRKIYFMYIGLGQVISKAFVNKPKRCRHINLNKYIYARLHSLQSCIITAINCWGTL